MRQTAGPAGTGYGFVPGMAQLVPPADTNAVAHRAEALRLLAALPDTVVLRELLDSLGGVAWSEPSLELWREDGLEILIARRRRAMRIPGDYERWVEEELVIAERPAGSAGAFERGYGWHTAYDPDETSSMWIESGWRVGPRRRFALMAGYEGKEGGGGALLVRGPDGWHEAVSWSSGC